MLRWSGNIYQSVSTFDIHRQFLYEIILRADFSTLGMIERGCASLCTVKVMLFVFLMNSPWEDRKFSSAEAREEMSGHRRNAGIESACSSSVKRPWTAQRNTRSRDGI
ncbi:hypothetical protein CRG98_011884 [Punica granatum]|uniref:Uncharacterized protein n=1 Tax=Punica granatum TaxID=22663 RepID=A0A2I0KGS6_PUNGR|nr:hypothetical protein CRG98_011884 [Punica granatum]